ncbi:MAG: TlpA family protein disulfide reductase [Fibrobacteria bacterium]|nr:TlpA family protein disulfide reductase [Fibrobacteria bacterium]
MNKIIISYLIFCLSSFAAETVTPGLKAGDQAPPIILRNMDGTFTRLSQFTGKKLYKPWKNKKKHVVILSFWATDCIPCQQEIPQMEKLAAKYQDNVKLLLISIDRKGKEIIAPFLKDNPFNSTVLLDLYQKTAERYNATRVPTLVVIDKDGVIRYLESGYKGKQQLNQIEKIIKKYQAQKKPGKH